MQSLFAFPSKNVALGLQIFYCNALLHHEQDR